MEERTGLPRTTARPIGNAASVPGKAQNTESTNWPKIRFVNPDTEFCSRIAVGIPRSFAVNTKGPEEYPPTPSTTLGFVETRIRKDLKNAKGSRNRVFNLFKILVLFKAPSFSVFSGYPWRGTNFSSIPPWAPTKTARASSPNFARHASATATPAKMCPPVPPPAIIRVSGLEAEGLVKLNAILFRNFLRSLSDTQQNTHCKKIDQQRRSSIADEG